MLKVGLCKFEFFTVSQNINSNYKRKNDVFAATTDTEAWSLARGLLDL